MYSCNDTLPGGLPHSDIHGSTPARGSPWLFAACHVLHRLLVPRHPPNALLILDIPVQAVRPEPHHAQKPSSGYEGSFLEILYSAHGNPSQMANPQTACAANGRSIRPDCLFAPLNPHCPTVGALLSPTTLPVRQVG